MLAPAEGGLGRSSKERHRLSDSRCSSRLVPRRATRGFASGYSLSCVAGRLCCVRSLLSKDMNSVLEIAVKIFSESRTLILLCRASRSMRCVLWHAQT